MKKLLIAALAALFPIVAVAGDFPDGHRYRHVSGKQLSPASQSTSTVDSVDFGFTADVVRMCLWGTATQIPVYVRVGTTVTTVTASLVQNLRVPGSSPTAFISGSSGTVVADGAMSISGSGDGTDQHCVTIPMEARGIIMHVASGQATLDVTGFQLRK